MPSRDLESLLSALEATNLPPGTKVADLQRELTNELRLLADYPLALGSLAAEHRFAEQYERRAGILGSAGLTTDINGQALAYPSASDLHARMLERPELLAKMRQGFTRVQPVPSGASLQAFFPPLIDALRKYSRDGTLRATDGTKRRLNALEPSWMTGMYKCADQNGPLVYGPKNFDEDPSRHGGRTKAEILADPSASFQVHLTEHLRDIPWAGKGRSVGGRPQLEAGKEAKQYLALLGTAPYDLEAGYTPEMELAHLLCHVHETKGEVLDDYRSGSSCYCTGAWFLSHGGVPYVTFNRDIGQLRVAGVGPDYVRG